MNTITVLIAEDDDAVRDALLVLLRSEGIRARAFASGADLLANLPEVDAACVITDVRMPDMDGIEVVQRLKALKGDAWPVVVITGHADVPMAVQMMKAGVVDFIEKPFDPNRLLEAVRGCLGHLSVLEGARQSRAEVAERIAQLSQRETQVFRALVEGRSNKEIAADLEISPRTVEIFRAKVMSKMQAKSLSALVRMGLTAPAE
ncbi:response regulator [Brevundimonas sp. NIBR11]|uniref:response regulator transcription factor n=1 Tax=Brevundimonas sp. NIBR11 TaxID=3015999 RepID=UPI0022EFEA91|nr:response regulator [Brevundimonas sp. NIBR11]WGM31912.1 Transcriptional regulatory protein FixJ [Brevundimonas sp. NIBR11]